MYAFELFRMAAAKCAIYFALWMGETKEEKFGQSMIKGKSFMPDGNHAHLFRVTKLLWISFIVVYNAEKWWKSFALFSMQSWKVQYSSDDMRRRNQTGSRRSLLFKQKFPPLPSAVSEVKLFFSSFFFSPNRVWSPPPPTKAHIISSCSLLLLVWLTKWTTVHKSLFEAAVVDRKSGGGGICCVEIVFVRGGGRCRPDGGSYWRRDINETKKEH
jgi:hypothetical protein